MLPITVWRVALTVTLVVLIKVPVLIQPTAAVINTADNITDSTDRSPVVLTVLIVIPSIIENDTHFVKAFPLPELNILQKR